MYIEDLQKGNYCKAEKIKNGTSNGPKNLPGNNLMGKLYRKTEQEVTDGKTEPLEL